MLPTSASFLITENCNLACKYCFEKHNDKIMSKEVAQKALEFLSDNALVEQHNDFHAMLFGGEPLLNIDLIDFIFHTGEEIAQRKGLKFTTSIITNGTIMSDEIKSVLSWHKNSSHLTLQLSIDGNKESQDLYRITKTGQGSFDLVQKNIKDFQEIFRDDLYKLCFHACVNKQTIDKMYENYTFFKQTWGAKNIWFLPVMEEKWDAEDVAVYDQQNQLIFDDIVSELKETRNLNLIKQYAPMDRCMNHEFADKPCGAGGNFVTVTAEGELYPCHQIYFNDPEKTTKIGDVFSGLDEEKRRPYVEYTRHDLQCNHECKNNNCYRCIAVNFVKNHDIFKQITGAYCDLMSVDKKYQDKLEAEIKELGLIRQEDRCQDCLCNSRECYDANTSCDVVKRQSVCESGNNPYNPNCLCDAMPPQQPSQFEETVALALQVILSELAEIKETLAQINDNQKDE